MPVTVAILSAHRHPRLRYILKVLSLDLGFQLRLYTDPEKWQKADAAAKIAYGLDLPEHKVPVWPASRFLSGGQPSAEDLRVSWVNDAPIFFGGDLLACCFYALSRYEEYEAFIPDNHGRFPAKASHAGANDYLELPVVRIWSRLLAARLKTYQASLPQPRQRPFTFRPTYDIDLLWAYQHRGWRGVASGIRDMATGNLRRAKERFTTPPAEDPYNIIDDLLSLHPHHRADIFWLLADDQAREDVNPYPIPEAQKLVMKEVSLRVNMGIHPGYNTTGNKEKLSSEIHCLRDILGRYPTHSRQHFLRFQLPETYRQLQLQGITHEHSMGYADAIGWRAGTNLPFFWYDLEQERATGLTVCPFAAMDVTLKNYLKLTPEAAQEKILQLAEHCRPFGGDFALLWHNSSFAPAYGWAGWRQAYEGIVRSLTK